MKTSMRIVRKYKNRKLYDTRTSKYVTLEQVLALYQNSRDEAVRVLDPKQNDITEEVLARAFLKYDEDFRQMVLAYIEQVGG